MSEALSYALPGIPYGCTFALVAIGLVLSYRATGVFNFAFGAQAYVAALIYAVLCEHAVPRGVAGVLSIVIISPVMGLLIDRFCFSRIASSNVAAKTIAAIGLMVGLPALATIVFGPTPVASPPSLLFNVNTVVFHLDGTPINGVQLSTVLVTLVVLLALTSTLRFTSLGLSMRAAVESPRLLRLEGVSASSVSATAWATSSALAGLAGVLVAPRYATVSIDNYTVLLVAAIAAAAIAGLSSMAVAAGASVLIGVVLGLTTGYAPANSVWSTGLFSAIPFFLLLGLLAFSKKMRSLGVSEDPMAGIDPPPQPVLLPPRSAVLDSTIKTAGPLVLVMGVISVLTWVPSAWTFALTSGMALALVFMSITLVTGAAGQVSLCQATFAGVGAFTAGQLATNHGVPIMTGAIAGAMAAVGGGLLAVLPALRLRGLALSLSTLTFALLADAIVFPTTWIGGPPTGLTVPRPMLGPISFATDSTKAFFVLVVAIVVVIGFFVRRLLNGSTGRLLEASKLSPLATAGLGFSPTKTKIAVFGISAGVAGIGGALYGSLLQVVSPGNFTSADSLLFVVIVVTVGVTTVAGAIEAGIAFAMVTQLATYLPDRMAPVSIVAVLFSLGAFAYARHPEGVVERLRRSAAAKADELLGRFGTTSFVSTEVAK